MTKTGSENESSSPQYAGHRYHKNIDTLIGKYVHHWEQMKTEKKYSTPTPNMSPTICFSRPIGCGVREIAGALAEKINYRVIDREIIEYASDKMTLTHHVTDFLNEQYPGVITKYLMMLAGDKALDTSKSTKLLFSAIYSIANLQPTIFIGRGAYLILPKDKTLSVRFICSRETRIKKIMERENLSESEADKRLKTIDKEQQDFFKVVFHKEKLEPEEFDLVINCETMGKPEWAAAIVEAAFKQKFENLFK